MNNADIYGSRTIPISSAGSVINGGISRINVPKGYRQRVSKHLHTCFRFLTDVVVFIGPEAPKKEIKGKGN